MLIKDHHFPWHLFWTPTEIVEAEIRFCVSVIKFYQKETHLFLGVEVDNITPEYYLIVNSNYQHLLPNC